MKWLNANTWFDPGVPELGHAIGMEHDNAPATCVMSIVGEKHGRFPETDIPDTYCGTCGDCYDELVLRDSP